MILAIILSATFACRLTLFVVLVLDITLVKMFVIHKSHPEVAEVFIHIGILIGFLFFLNSSRQTIEAGVSGL